MTPKVKELIVQAIHEIGPETNEQKEETLQRFAELIIGECAAMARNLSAHGEYAEQSIKEHFGIGV